MRLRIILLAVATSSLVLVSFLVPLALVLRSFAADRAVSAATGQAQSIALLVPLGSTHGLQLEVQQANAVGGAPVTVFFPDGTQLGPPGPAPDLALAAQRSRVSRTVAVAGGVEILVAVEGLRTGTAVVRAYVPDAVLHRGVARAWLLLGCVGLFLLLLSVLVADQLARSLVRPLNVVARVSDRLAAGDLSARAPAAGPLAVRRAAAGLNRLADRIGELLAHERETVADLSHRLRTPLTALRIDAESLRGPARTRQVLLADVDAVERTVNEIIRAARHPAAGGGACDAVGVVAGRVAFWQPLAEDQARPVLVAIPPGPLPVRVSAEDLAACTDVLLENVFAHTPEGAGFEVRLSGRAAGGAWLVIADDGPGFPVTGPGAAGPGAAGPGAAGADPTQRGLSARGSTGLGLDIARRLTESAGGTLTIGRSASGGGSVTLGLGPPAGSDGSAPPARRHGRTRVSRP